MRNLAIIAALGLAVTAFFLTRGEETPTSVTTPAPIDTDSKSVPSSAHYATHPKLAPEVPIEPAQQSTAVPQTDRTVRLSGQEQKPGEPDDQYRRRLSWLKRFASFEERANMTPEQRERLMGLLADKQEESILGWEAYNRGAREVSPEDRRRMIEDRPFEAYPTFLTIEKDLQRDLWSEMRKFLTPKQMVSFRRTSRLNDIMGYARWLPLEIERSPIASMDAGDSGSAL